ncbi:dipeptidyl peptidase 1-like [Ostrea edulis]|uniref:dipeptidyl peptidase 1-like n=1 Tax=Ostrea edulis TaxID=37623 RepID=UPI0020950744|nr:dipeptidyl peptidase 1-like [Ostrea edulis]
MLVVAGFLSLFAVIYADTPANCTYEDIQGRWMFQIGSRGHDNTIKCDSVASVESTVYVTLKFPDIAVDDQGNIGFWTLIYNQGFEVSIEGRKYFAFSAYKKVERNITSQCGKTLPGWTHGVLERNWACFQGQKVTPVPPKYHVVPERHSAELLGQLKYRIDHDFITQINQKQNLWKATTYKEMEDMTLEDLVRRAGGRKSKIIGIPKPASASEKVKRIAEKLPETWDWRDSGFVSPVRNQGGCGSCYAFSSLGMNEARWRLRTNNTQQPVFSTQDIVECSEYSQGCEGGFPYLIGGKYAEDFGLVDEKCNPYKGKDGKCSTQQSCPRQYSYRYQYVGGFYGACNEELMMINLVKNGPMAVSFEVYNDFMSYKGGIYVHTGLEEKFNPFEITNHAVLLVGYGVDPVSKVKFWTIKNSWGTEWGEKGYFRIRRGTDECSIESIAVESFPLY